MESRKKRVLLSDPSFEAANISDEASFHTLSMNAEIIRATPNSEADMIELTRDADAIILGDFPLSGRIISSANKLKLIARCGVGYDNVDVRSATVRGILVSNVPGVMAEAVAEHTLLLMLAVAKRLVFADSCVRMNKWTDFFAAGPGFELLGKTLGVVGFGAIGSSVTRKAKAAFDMNVLVFDPYVKDEIIKSVSATPATLEQLLRQSDIVSLHAPLQPTTRGLIGRKELGLMKKSAILINTSRGSVVDELALADKLNAKQIAAAGLDVFAEEPPDARNSLLGLENAVLTPHIASFTKEATRTMWQACIGAVLDVLRGGLPRPPAKIVNCEVLENLDSKR